MNKWPTKKNLFFLALTYSYSWNLFHSYIAHKFYYFIIYYPQFSSEWQSPENHLIAAEKNTNALAINGIGSESDFYVMLTPKNEQKKSE